MKMILRTALAAGILLVVAVGGHAGLQALAAGEGDGMLARGASNSCAYCHGSGL